MSGVQGPGLAVRFRLVTSVLALVVMAGYVLGIELTPPGTTFRDVAELEGLAEPTGINAIENGLSIVRYMIDASVWTVGFLLVGLVGYAVRTTWTHLSSVPRSVPWLSIPDSRRRTIARAATGGLLHAAVMAWYAVRIGGTLPGGLGWLLSCSVPLARGCSRRFHSSSSSSIAELHQRRY
ncbi:MAG: hypothetical protein ACQET5_13325 [Halobacteriota archaeon]